MIDKSSTFISGVLAVGMYVGLVGLLVFYFNTRDAKKPVHYVKKNDNRIRVTMASPQNKIKNKNKKVTREVVKKKTIVKKKPVKKVKTKKKETVKKQKDTRKKVIKEKIVKKVKPKKVVKKTPLKKVNKPKDLFANVSSSKKSVKKNTIKVTNKPSASKLVSSTLKIQKKSDRGIENAYFALIEERLKGWPAQSEYAGKMAKVWIKVEPSGSFIFKVVTASANEDFNKGLISYLEQLQQFGFGKHKGERAYELNVEFVATE